MRSYFFLQKVRTNLRIPLVNSFSRVYSKSAFFICQGEIRINFMHFCKKIRMPLAMNTRGAASCSVVQRGSASCSVARRGSGLGRDLPTAPESWWRYVYTRQTPSNYILYIIYYILIVYIIHYILYIMYYILYIIYHILYTMYYILYIIHYILYIIYYIL